MKTFQTIQDAVNFIKDHANTGNEMVVNDCLCFGMGVYANTSECIAAGIRVDASHSAYQALDESELGVLLAWLQRHDGYLIAA